MLPACDVVPVSPFLTVFGFSQTTRTELGPKGDYCMNKSGGTTTEGFPDTGRRTDRQNKVSAIDCQQPDLNRSSVGFQMMSYFIYY